MVARTGGRFEPRAAPTFAGTSIPAAVLPEGRILVRNLIALCLGRLGLWRVESLGQPVVANRQLDDADVVAERVANPEVGSVKVLFRLGGELDAARLERLVGLAAVRSRKAEREAARSLGYDVANLVRGLRVHGRRAGQLEQNVASGLARNSHGDPPHEPEVHVIGELQPELVDVEVDRLVLVENVDVGYVDEVLHRISSCVWWLEH